MRCAHLSKGHRGKNGERRQIASPFHPPLFFPVGLRHRRGLHVGQELWRRCINQLFVCSCQLVLSSTSSGGITERVTLRCHKVHMQSCNLVVFFGCFFSNYHRDGRTEGFWNPSDLSSTSSEKHLNVEDMLKSKRLKLFYKFTTGHFSFLFCSDKIS